MGSFEEFDRSMERCYTDLEYCKSIMPDTLEGCVVRLSDIISYLGKDRQDAARTKIVDESIFMDDEIGSINAEIINNLCVNVIENSYGKPYIKLDDKHFKALQKARRENYRLIYNNAASLSKLDTSVKPMMVEIYGQLLEDLVQENKYSPIWRHHINVINRTYYKHEVPYEATEPNQIVVDYIASMTDDYFIALHKYLFPESPLQVKYKDYFNEDSRKREKNDV
jgi:dGTPase